MTNEARKAYADIAFGIERYIKEHESDPATERKLGYLDALYDVLGTIRYLIGDSGVRTNNGGKESEQD